MDIEKKVLEPHQLDISKIEYGVPKTNDNQGKSIYMSLDKSPIIIQTPEMYAPFGLKKWDNDRGVKYTLDLSFRNMDKRPSLQTFFDKMTELDNKLIDDAQVNAYEWLKKKGATREGVKLLYTNIVKYPTDKTGEITDKYPPTFKLSIPFTDGGFKCYVYNSLPKNGVNPPEVDLNTLETKGARITALIQCLGIWVAAGKFGCTWKVQQMLVLEPPKLGKFNFVNLENKKEEDVIDDEEVIEEHDDIHALATPAKADEEDDDIVESSEDEDDLEVKKPVAKASSSSAAAKKSVVKKK